jgi:hypothetical protein
MAGGHGSVEKWKRDWILRCSAINLNRSMETMDTWHSHSPITYHREEAITLHMVACRRGSRLAGKNGDSCCMGSSVTFYDWRAYRL